jgi:hypothetical protein
LCTIVHFIPHMHLIKIENYTEIVDNNGITLNRHFAQFFLEMSGS